MNEHFTLSNPIFDQRSRYYQNSTPARPAKSVNPAKHTMKPAPFKKYIGRYGSQQSYSISGKKFNDAQKEQLVEAYRGSLKVQVFGAPRADKELLARMHSSTIEDGTVVKFCRPKIFNKYRQTMCFVQTKQKSRELWVFVFPSANYVDQIAELILAIFEDFRRSGLQPNRSPEVLINHFPDLEKQVSQWTELDQSMSHLIRYGDAVAIGNVDQLVEGLGELGFQALSDDWEFVGFEGMFALKVFRDPASARRLVLFGVTECFWGQASAHYVESLLNCGARHILYASKAATLIDWDVIGRVFSPHGFYVYDENENGKKDPISREGVHDSGVRNSIFAPFQVNASGLSITGPTVVGEDNDQRARYNALNPSCMDCENGYIARVVSQHNKRLTDQLGESFGKDAHFVPIHFITDYIYRGREKRNKQSRDLSVHDHPTFLEERSNSFRRIGNCFAVYALKLG
jgi:hypothetical protein